MTDRFRAASLVLATLTTGLAAGFFYAYACSVTLGLGRLDDAGYVAAMQAINATVRNPVFAFSFFGALGFGLLTAALHAPAWRQARARWVALGAALYALGAFLPTMLASVPLNQALAAAGPEARGWYEAPWNAWNLLRTVLSTAGFLALLLALASSPPAAR